MCVWCVCVFGVLCVGGDVLCVVPWLEVWMCSASCPGGRCGGGGGGSVCFFFLGGGDVLGLVPWCCGGGDGTVCVW